jgi:putative copper export protein
VGSILNAATGWTLYAGLIAALGGCVARWIIIPHVVDRPAEVTGGFHVAAGRLALSGAVLLVPAMALIFLRQLLAFRDPFVPWTEDANFLLTRTAWGMTWHLGLAGAVVAVVAFALAARGSRVGWWIGGLAALALGAFPAFTGHASGGEGPRTLMLTADILHVWAAGGWIGGLAFVLYAERRWRTSPANPREPAGRTGADEQPSSVLPTLVPLFSPVAVVCVAVLVATGGVGAWVHVPNLAALFGSTYGRTLLLKLTLVAGVLGLGFVNWRKLTPRLGSAEGAGGLRSAASVELLVVQAVLVVTALLVRTAPPMP